MRQAVMMIVMLIVLSATPTMPGSTAVGDAYPLGVYWPWERVGGLAERSGMDKWDYVETCLDDMKAHNVNAVWVVNLGISDLGPLLERIEQRQMKIVPALAALHYKVSWRRKNWDYLRKKAKAAIEIAGDSDAVLAWCLCDEPRKSFVGEMETYRRKFQKWGAKQRAVVVTMWHDTPAYAEQTDFPIVCPDIYPFFSEGNPNGPAPAPVSRNWYWRHAGIAAQAASKQDKTPWIMPQSFVQVWGPWEYDERGDMVILPGGILHWRPPQPSEMRWQVWSAIARGIQGFFWFCYAPSPDDSADKEPYSGDTFPQRMAEEERRPLDFPGALIHPDGSPTDQYEAAAEAFGAIEPHIPLLKKLDPAQESFAKVDSPGRLGSLQDPNSGRKIIVIVNDDPENAREFEVRLSGGRKVRNLRNDSILEAEGTERMITVKLSAGEGTLLEIME